MIFDGRFCPTYLLVKKRTRYAGRVGSEEIQKFGGDVNYMSSDRSEIRGDMTTQGEG